MRWEVIGTEWESWEYVVEAETEEEAEEKGRALAGQHLGMNISVDVVQRVETCLV